jgi:prepilin-type N-terminal cleavage/methylation domain-containing protein
MIMRNSTKKNLGFTLVELAIVLAVTGVLFAGLYRLLSGGNQQVKDTSVASQQVQLINAVKGFLSSTDGQNWLGANGGSTNTFLPLPTAAPDGGFNVGCKATLAVAIASFCDALPAGFSSATVNAYGQVFDDATHNAILVQTGPVPATAPAGTPPTTYSFMIVTSGGDPIPDADGGRISSQIGSDGGFIYKSPVCSPAAAVATTACGTSGGWTVTTTGAVPNFVYAPATTSGHVASRTFISPEFFSSLPWLARQFMTGTDAAATTTTSPNYNTMKTGTDLFLGNNNLWLSNNINLTYPYAAVAGTINLQGGQITDPASTRGASIFITGTGPNSYLSSAAAPLGSGAAPLAKLFTNCTADSNVPVGTKNSFNLMDHADCQLGLLVSGDEDVLGLLQANSLYAGTFIYQSSDLRLKKDIQPIPHALDDVMQMKPVSFTFKAGGQKGLGVIAQDMEKIYPQLVTQKRDGMKSVNYDGLVAPLIAAVQELKAQNDELRQQLQEQAKRQDRLEKSSKERANDAQR